MSELRGSHRTRRLGVALVVLLLLAAALAAVAVARHGRSPARVFEDGYGVGSDTWTVGRTMWVTLELVPATGRTITIDSLEPRFATDAAAAEVEYVVCDLDAAALAEAGVGGPGSGGRDNDVDRYCSHLTPAAGATLALGNDPGSALLVGITPTRPGRSAVRSHRIEFSEEGRQGTADVEVGVEVVAH